MTSKGHPLGTPEPATDLAAFSFFLEIDCDRFLLGVGILVSCQRNEDGNSSELAVPFAKRTFSGRSASLTRVCRSIESTGEIARRQG